LIFHTDFLIFLSLDRSIVLTDNGRIFDEDFKWAQSDHLTLFDCFFLIPNAMQNKTKEKDVLVWYHILKKNGQKTIIFPHNQKIGIII